MADTSTFDVQKALDAGVSEDKIFDFLTKNNPQFDASKAVQSGQSRRNVIDFLAKQPAPMSTGPTIGPPTTPPNSQQNPNLGVSADILNQLKVRHVDKNGLNLPNRIPNDPRLIAPQEIGTDQGVIPGAQTGAGIAAALGIPGGAVADLAGEGAAAIPQVANALSKLKNLAKSAGTGALVGGGGSAIAGRDSKSILQNALEGAVLGGAGGSITSKLRELFSKAAPEAGAAMSEVPPITQSMAPGAVPRAPSSTLSPLSNTPPIANSPLSTYMGRGSTLGPLTKTIPSIPPPEPTIGRNLVTGKFLPQGTKLTDHLAGLNADELKIAYDKIQNEAGAQELRNKIVAAFAKLKSK